MPPPSPAHTSHPIHWSAALLGWVAGVVVQVQQPTLWPVHFYVTFVLLAHVSIAFVAIDSVAFKRLVPAGSVSRSVVWLLLCAGLSFGATGWRASHFASQALAPSLEGHDLRVTGVVASLPQRSEVGVRFRLDVTLAELAGQAVRVPKRMELTWYSGVFAQGDGAGEPLGELQRPPPPLQPGDQWQMTVRLKAPHGGVNPHGFDFELWQWEQGVQATGYVRASAKDVPPQWLSAGMGHPMQRWRAQVRERVYAQVSDPQTAGVLVALVAGDQAAIERADWDVFRATGVAHLMSISGLHVTMFAWLAAWLVGWAWQRSPWLCLRLSAPTAALAGGLVLATAYALFSGWGVPAQRTVVMLATVVGLRGLGLRWPWPQVWLLACAVLLLWDPWAVLQAGFWLSFVAVGVLFASGAGAPAKSTGLRARAGSLWREQWVVTLALTPLSLLLFGQTSVVALLANLVAIPWVTLVVTPLAMLGVVWPWVWQAASAAVAGLMALLSALAALPWATLAVAQAPWWAGVAGVLGGVMLALPWPVTWRLLGLPLVMPVLFWQPITPAVGEFALLATDIGQGNAVLVRTAHHALLYDAGPRYSSESDAGHRVLVPLLLALGVRLDTVVLSHSDSDHTGGAAAVLAMHPQAGLLSSIGPQHPLHSQRVVTRCEAGQRWHWDGVDFEVLHPLPGDFADTRKTNALSCVLRLSNGRQTALLAGDIEQAQEARLVRSGAPLRADVLLVPHHGSKTSSSGEFLDAVQPRLALVQAGYRNRFHHPASPVLVRYAQRHIRVVDTPRCGAIGWQSSAPAEVHCERETQPHYWRHAVSDADAALTGPKFATH